MGDATMTRNQTDIDCLYYLPVLRQQKEDTDTDSVQGLLLTPAEGCPQGWYQRFGVFDMRQERGAALRDASEAHPSTSSYYSETEPGTIFLV